MLILEGGGVNPVPIKDREAFLAYHRKYQKEWRLRPENIEKARAIRRVVKKRTVERNRRIIAEAQAEGCSRCDERDLRCLDFHHVDPTTKSFGFGRGQARDCGETKLRAEIAKCIVLCSNCHRKLHGATI